jgi:hypothetical protein
VKVGFAGGGILYAGHVWCIRCQAASWSTSWGLSPDPRASLFL